MGPLERRRIPSLVLSLRTPVEAFSQGRGRLLASGAGRSAGNDLMWHLCRTFLSVSDTYIVMPIVVHEFVTCPVPEEELDRPEQLEHRCCLFRMRVPPDQLNPQVRISLTC